MVNRPFVYKVDILVDLPTGNVNSHLQLQCHDDAISKKLAYYRIEISISKKLA